jgi:hypothetical protein
MNRILAFFSRRRGPSRRPLSDPPQEKDKPHEIGQRIKVMQ